MLSSPRISIVIPACNAVTTLGETMACLLAQSFTDWEALIVDNGSTDGTGALAATLAEADPRIRALRLEQRGVSIARNAGIQAARAAWLLFHDADDWLADDALAKLVAEADADPAADFIHGAWARSYPDGHLGHVEGRLPDEPLFNIFTLRCPWAIHACLVRKALVETVGGFDPGLAICEDWDLWQRIARAGARDRGIDDVLAYYRQRPGSATRDHSVFLRCWMEVARRTHGRDPRVAQPRPEAAAGAPSAGLVPAAYDFATWLAAWCIGQGGDGAPLLAPLAGMAAPGLNPVDIGVNLHDGLRLGREERAVDWAAEWPALWPKLQPVLDQLERLSRVPALAMRARRVLERRLLDELPPDRMATIGSQCRAPFPAQGKIADLSLAPQVDRLLGRVHRDGAWITSFELPVQRKVAGALLTRVVAEEVAAVDLPAVAVPQPRTAGQEVPVLMYHRVADRCPPGLEPYCVSPRLFDQHLLLLRRHGYRTVSLDEWREHRRTGEPLAGQPVLLTFDDGYLDVLTHAWPILRHHGMTATVFLVSDAVGQAAAWDAGYGSPAPLMSWRDIHALRHDGMSFGAHGATHRPLTGLTTADLLWEGNRSRAVLEREFGQPVTSMAYPYGAHDEAVERAMIDCGYDMAFTTESGLAGPSHRSLRLPRLDIRGTDTLSTFAATLGIATTMAAAAE